jgi:two-component system OmpR family sensor kinase
MKSLKSWSLRTRLVAITILFTVVAISASDFVAYAKLDRLLVSQIDKQLNLIAGGSVLRLDQAGIDPNAHGDDGQPSPDNSKKPLNRVPTTTVITLVDSSGNYINQIGGENNGGTPTTSNTLKFSGLTSAVVIATNGKPFTAEAVGTHDEYRILARTLPSGFGSVIVSIPLEPVHSTMQELLLLFLLISLVILVLVAAGAHYLIRWSFKPLTQIETTAGAIAAGDLSQRLADDSSDTEVGRLTNSLNTMLSRIEDSFKVKEESENRLRRFAADASHELRTPLTAIRGFSELHRQGAVKGEENVSELISRIEKESIRMSSLVEDLLLLARMDQAPEVKKVPVNIVEIVDEAVTSASAASKDHPVIFNKTMSEAFILGDELRIHQSVANLLANARTHTPDGTQITVSVEEDDTEVRISVSDNGPGIPAELHSKLFERFYRADPSRSRRFGEGSGLGLSIVSTVMGAHGGSVSVESELGKGSTFTLHFPIESN